jgi:hypothetical protein
MKQPPLITPREVDVPRAQRHTLPNGASLYAIPLQACRIKASSIFV